MAGEENFEFKDNSDLYNDDYLTRQPVGTLPASAMYDESMMQTQKSPDIASRYSFVDSRISHANALSDRYYTRHVASHGLSKKQDFKVSFSRKQRAIIRRSNISNPIIMIIFYLLHFDEFKEDKSIEVFFNQYIEIVCKCSVGRVTILLINWF